MTTMASLRATAALLAERVRQNAKWGEQNHPDADPVLLNREGGVTPKRLAEHHEIATGHRARFLCQTAADRGQANFMAILVEEVGEACDEIAKGDTAALREELVQIAAVAVQWVEAIERRNGRPAKRVYLSGPIASDPDAREHFAQAAASKALAGSGAEIINPFDVAPFAHGGPCGKGYAPGDGEHGHTSSACFMRTDLLALLTCDEIHMLPGWRKSRGAAVELAVAEACGMRVSYAEGRAA